MLINFLDKEFPKEIKYKIFKIEEYILKETKIKKYNIYYDYYLNRVIFKLNFEIINVSISIEYNCILNENTIDIYYYMRSKIDDELLKLIYKEV